MTTIAVKERPMIFDATSVRAILAGAKTQTRRVVKNPDWFGCLTGDCPHNTQMECDADLAARCPHGVVGDRIWVRERWQFGGNFEVTEGFNHNLPQTKATWDQVYYAADDNGFVGRPWRSPVFMPRKHSRITLQIVKVRVERLQLITEADARAEGILEVTKDGRVRKYCVYDVGDHSSVPWQAMPRTAVECFSARWDGVNAHRGHEWIKNDWVWVIEWGPT